MVAMAFAVCMVSRGQAQMDIDRPGSGDPSQRQRSEGPEIPTPPNRPAALPQEPEARAEGLRLSGQCQLAVPIFRQLAANGAGFEIAEYNLGLCLFDISKSEPNAERAASLRMEGAQDILKAANGGFPRAQSSLIAMYLDGDGVARDPVEAGKWSLIYHANVSRMMLGLPDVPVDLRARLNSVLTDKTWQEARTRADAWAPLQN